MREVSYYATSGGTKFADIQEMKSGEGRNSWAEKLKLSA